MISNICPHPIVGPVITFLFIFGAFALNFIAMELEDPFGEDPNDLPLADFQAEMNNCLLMLLHTNTDMIPGTSEECVMDFHGLLRTMDISSETGEPGRASA